MGLKGPKGPHDGYIRGAQWSVRLIDRWSRFLPFSPLATQTWFKCISWGKQAAALFWFPCLNLGPSLSPPPLFLLLSVPCSVFCSSRPVSLRWPPIVPLSASVTFPPPVDPWRVAFPHFFVSHFHMLFVSQCSPVFQIYLDPPPPFFCSVVLYLSHGERGHFNCPPLWLTFQG